MDDNDRESRNLSEINKEIERNSQKISCLPLQYA